MKEAVEFFKLAMTAANITEDEIESDEQLLSKHNAATVFKSQEQVVIRSGMRKIFAIFDCSKAVSFAFRITTQKPNTKC